MVLYASGMWWRDRDPLQELRCLDGGGGNLGQDHIDAWLSRGRHGAHPRWGMSRQGPGRSRARLSPPLQTLPEEFWHKRGRTAKSGRPTGLYEQGNHGEGDAVAGKRAMLQGVSGGVAAPQRCSPKRDGVAVAEA